MLEIIHAIVYSALPPLQICPEAFHTLALVELVAPPRIRQQIVWSGHKQ